MKGLLFVDDAVYERLINEMMRRDFAWAYLEPKFKYTGQVSFFLPRNSNKRESIPKA